MEWLVERPPVIESSHEKAKRLGQMFDALAADYGPTIITEVTNLLKSAEARGEVPQGSEIAQLLASHETRDEFATKSQNELRKIGILSDEGFSLSKFTDNRRRKFADLVDPEDKTFASTRGEYLANTFGTEPITIVEKPENGAKQLIYSPKTRSEAFNVNAIKAANFHLGYWEFPSWLDKENIETQTAPGTLDNTKSLETAVAAILYNPKFGDARRTTQGKLEVRYPNGQYRAITSDWFKSQSGLAIHNEKQGGLLFDRPLAALKEYCPTLFAEGLLNDSDFTASRHQTHTHLEASQVPANGILAINGIKHNLGRHLAGHTVRIESLNATQSAIVLDENGLLTPLSIINRFHKGDAGLTSYENGKGAFSYFASAELTKPTFLVLLDTKDKPELGAAIDNLHIWTKLNNQLRSNSIDVDASLPMNTREYFRLNASKLAPYTEQIVNLARDTGSIGLQSIAEIADLPDIAREYLRVVAELRTPEATLLAESVIEAGSTRRQILAEVAKAVSTGDMTPETGRLAKYELTRRVASAITAMEDVARTATLQNKPALDTFKQDLARRNTDLALFGSSLRTVGKEGRISLEKLQGVEYQQRIGKELTDQEKPDMRHIFAENWQSMTVAEREPFRRSMEKAFLGDSATFTMALYHNKLAAFFRLDQVPNIEPGALYVGSFNVDQKLQDSGLGKQLLADILDPLAKEHTILADFIVSLDAGSSYVEDQNFILSGLNSVTEEGVTSLRFSIRRNDTENAKYQTKSEIPADYPDQASFTLPTDINRMADYCQQKFAAGFVATHFFMPNKDKSKRTIIFEKSQVRKP
jgi:hypothetical protein